MVYESIFPQHCAPCEAWQELREQPWSSAAHHALATSLEVGSRSGWATRVPGSAEPRPAWREMQIRPSSMLPAEGGFSVQAPSSLSLQLECWFYFCILWAWEGELISSVQYGPLEKVLSKGIFLPNAALEERLWGKRRTWLESDLQAGWMGRFMLRYYILERRQRKGSLPGAGNLCKGNIYGTNAFIWAGLYFNILTLVIN